MSFDSDERSVSDSHPRECWALASPSSTSRYTTAELSLVFGGNTYNPAPGARSELVASSVADPPEMVLTLPVTNGFVQAHAFGTPPQDLQATIFRVQAGGAGVTYFQGPITAFTVDGNVCHIRVASQLADALETVVPSARVQRMCNHVLYDARCTMDPESASNKLATTVASPPSGRTIVVASVGALGVKLKSGYITRDSDDEKRLIVAVSGTTLTVNMAFRTLASGNAVTLRRGCQHSIEVCVADFNNAVNFGGHPYLPSTNPFRGDIRGNPWD